MLAFYGWTDFLILNLVNVKKSYYPDEKGHLFVLMLPRVSTELVKIIKDNHIFDAVTELSLYEWSIQNKILGKIEKLFYGRRQYRHYAGQLLPACRGETYQKFFTGAFWAESLHLFNYFYDGNPNIEINFVEEGTASYSNTKNLLRCMPCGGLRELIFRVSCFFPCAWRARNLIDKFFIYQPDICRTTLYLKLLQLPTVTPASTVNKVLNCLADNVNITPYEKARFFYCVTPITPGYEETPYETHEIFKFIMQELPSSEILVRPHPDFSARESAMNLYNKGEIFLETSGVLLESIFSQIDMREKVLIARNSTILLTPKMLFGQEPYIIMTHRLYTVYKKRGDPNAELCFKQICALYDNKNRIFAPETIGELQILIRDILR